MQSLSAPWKEKLLGTSENLVHPLLEDSDVIVDQPLLLLPLWIFHDANERQISSWASISEGGRARQVRSTHLLISTRYKRLPSVSDT